MQQDNTEQRYSLISGICYEFLGLYNKDGCVSGGVLTQKPPKYVHDTEHTQ